MWRFLPSRGRRIVQKLVHGNRPHALLPLPAQYRSFGKLTPTEKALANKKKRIKHTAKQVLIPAFIGPRTLSKRLRMPMKNLLLTGMQVFPWWPQASAKQMRMDGFSKWLDISLTHEEAALLAETMMQKYEHQNKKGVIVEFQELQGSDLLPGWRETDVVLQGHSRQPIVAVTGAEQGAVDALYKLLSVGNATQGKMQQNVEHVRSLITDTSSTTMKTASPLGMPVVSNLKQDSKKPCAVLSEDSLSLLALPVSPSFVHLQELTSLVSDIIVVAIDSNIPLDESIEAPLSIAVRMGKPIVIALLVTEGQPGGAAQVQEMTTQLTASGLPADYIVTVPVTSSSSSSSVSGHDEADTAVEGLRALLRTVCGGIDLTANIDCAPKGHVLDATVEYGGRGKMMQLLLTEGSLSPGDPFVSGVASGIIRDIYVNVQHEASTQRVEKLFPGTVAYVTGGLKKHIPASDDDFFVGSADCVTDTSEMRAREFLYEYRDEFYPHPDALPSRVGYLELPPAREREAMKQEMLAARTREHDRLLALTEGGKEGLAATAEEAAEEKEEELLAGELTAYNPALQHVNNEAVTEVTVTQDKIPVILKTRTSALLHIMMRETDLLNGALQTQWSQEFAYHHQQQQQQDDDNNSVPASVPPALELTRSTIGAVSNVDVETARQTGKRIVCVGMGPSAVNPKMRKYAKDCMIQIEFFKTADAAIAYLEQTLVERISH